MTSCQIIPPYLLDELSRSDDPHVAERARRTREATDRLREGRLSARPSPTPRVTKKATGGLDRTVYDAQHETDLPGQQVRAEGEPATGDDSVTRAYDGLGSTYALWQEVYGRNSLDGKGLPLLASVHYDRDYDNAFWNDTQMVFGDGDGTVFLDFTRSLDVIGHELAHGVTQYTSGLNYQGQSGALNEHVSDVFGILVKQRALGQTAESADWLIGAELLAPGIQGQGLRSMAAPGTAYDDPALGRDPQPATMADYVETDDDNGGVHINSGIPNKAFHDVAVALGGDAWERAGQIWFDTITGDIDADCDFAHFADLTARAAQTRYGENSAEHTAVLQAWQGVGVTDAGDTPTTGDTTTTGDPEPPPPAVATQVRVRRSGGIAGVVREREIDLSALPEPDYDAWQRVLDSPELRQVAERPAHPDAFSYDVRWGDEGLVLPETALPREARDLFERTLEAD